jgi:hypothetical protein
MNTQGTRKALFGTRRVHWKPIGDAAAVVDLFDLWPEPFKVALNTIGTEANGVRDRIGGSVAVFACPHCITSYHIFTNII